MTNVAEIEMEEITLVLDGRVSKYTIAQRDHLDGVEYLGLIDSDALADFIDAARTGHMVSCHIEAARTHWVMVSESMVAEEVTDRAVLVQLNVRSTRYLSGEAV